MHDWKGFGEYKIDERLLIESQPESYHNTLFHKHDDLQKHSEKKTNFNLDLMGKNRLLLE